MSSCQVWELPYRPTVDSKKLEYGFWLMNAGFLSVFGLGIRGRSYSNFLASTVNTCRYHVEAFVEVLSPKLTWNLERGRLKEDSSL